MSDTDQNYPEPKTMRMSACAESLNGKIYLIGGMELDGTTLNLVEEYDPVNKVWRVKAPMPTARYGGDSVIWNDEIYVIGGRSGNSVYNTVEKYNPVTNKWSTLTSMPTARWNVMTEVIDGEIYAFGGISGTGNQRKDLDTLEKYSIRENKWYTLSPMPFTRQNGAVVASNNVVFLISGRVGVADSGSTSPRVDIYTPASGSWSSAPNLPIGRTGLKATAANGIIVVTGGAAQSVLNPEILIYKPSSGGWDQKYTLSNPRTGHCAVTIGNTVYVLAGTDRMDPPRMTNKIESFSF